MHSCEKDDANDGSVARCDSDFELRILGVRPTASRSNDSTRGSGSPARYDAPTVVDDATNWTPRRSDANSPYVPLPVDCLPRTYVREHECIVSFFGLPFFPWTGSETLEHEAGPGSDAPEFPTSTVAPGAMIAGTDNLHGISRVESTANSIAELASFAVSCAMASI